MTDCDSICTITTCLIIKANLIGNTWFKTYVLWNCLINQSIIFMAPVDPKRPDLPAAVFEQVEIGIKYTGYIARQEQQIKELRRVEAQRIPADIDYSKLTGLRLEAKEKLAVVRPENLGQAARISGVNPADVAALHILLESL